MRFWFLTAILWAGLAFPQQYPNKPLRWIVPTGAGSAVDVTARRIAPKLSEALGQPVVVENRPWSTTPSTTC
jgi:tripartite-type tricarboxylate transporter receptor subunit TctC